LSEEAPVISPIIDDFLEAVGIDDTKLRQLNENQAIYFGIQLGQILGLDEEHNFEDIAKHILSENKRLKRIEPSILDAYSKVWSTPETDIARIIAPAKNKTNGPEGRVFYFFFHV
jgi:hypothetical protein